MERAKGIRTRPHWNSKLEYIPEETRVKLHDWLLNQPISYRQIMVKLRDECGIEVCHETIGKYYRKWIWPIIVERREQLVDISTDYKKEVKRKPGAFTSATLDALSQRAMRISMKEETTAKEMKLIVDTLVRLREQQIKEQKLAIYLKQLRLAEKRLKAAESLAKQSKLTKEELVNKFRQIFHGEQNGKTNGTNVEGGGDKKASAQEPRFTHGFSN